MEPTDVVLLIVAGVAAGIVNGFAGGGSLITFPALIATGLSPVSANVTNSLSVVPGYAASAYGTRKDLAELMGDRRGAVWRLIPTAVAGGVVGCALLLLAPARAFDYIVPFLVLGAAAILAFQNRLRAVVGHPQDLSPRRRTLAMHGIVAGMTIYGGYFGAAMGVMAVAGLGLVIADTMARISALKNVISTTVGLTTVVVFSIFGPVDWLAVAVVAPATIVGGYSGARMARRLRSDVLRWIIVCFAVAVGVVLLVRAF
ncbi:sulfite exporter TauE/SafE family protein [Virgisporangium ochraceum]|uniref:Probable membrane transporter protein n=1 Tax=Virgisporangium ochraceum TaxID=65505 RepID=A0A8J3ZSR8_9ACTN|nr:sulfite exporter TauE/SafE family protein [Virgisporangium ochraceum]GIJ68317.1 UPF0721 transmembrane protein [Virgisporangium ochraceum]